MKWSLISKSVSSVSGSNLKVDLTTTMDPDSVPIRRELCCPVPIVYNNQSKDYHHCGFNGSGLIIIC